MGTPTYAAIVLESLLKQEDIEVVAIYTQMDKEVGRKKILTPPIVKTMAINNNIKCYQPARLRDIDSINELLKIECDYIVVAAYGQILPPQILAHAPCINLHASILPLYRGASPIQQALLNNNTQTGVTAMLMNEGLDTGDILKIRQIEILKNDMQDDLFNKLSSEAALLTIDVLREFKNYLPIKQDNSKASYCKKISKQDGLVEFTDAQDLFNKYRAFTPWPGVYLSSGLKLKKIELNQTVGKNKKGEILEINKECIVVGCEVGSLKIYKVQPESKNEMDILAYVNGKRLKIADILF